MSTAEEDIELRDLVAQTLEKNGCLGKLRAELRASIFLALDEDIKLSKQQPLQNLRIQSYLETPEGRAMFGLVREFLDFFNLQFTISVYEPESSFESIGQYEGRQKIAKDLGLINAEEPTVPLLQQLLKIAQAKNNVLDINLNVNSNTNGSYIDESLNIDSSYKKTETYNTLSKNVSNNDSTKLENDPNNESKPLPMENTQHLDKTFDLNSPTDNLSHLITGRSTENVPFGINILEDVIQEENEFEDNSSIKDKSRLMVNSNQTLKNLSNASKILGERNENFNKVNNPTVSSNYYKPVDIGNGRNKELYKKVIKEDDTYEDTSSIAEDSEVVNTNSLKTSEKSGNEVPLFSLPDNSLKLSDNSYQVPNTSANVELEKPKLSLLPQRPKTSLSSLTDLPPLSINKSRVSNDILPSLYSKEFKNKSHLKELDKMFDMDAKYEEDFLYGNNQLSLNSSPTTQIKKLLEEPVVVNKMDSEKLNILNRQDNKCSSKVVSEVGKVSLRPSVPKTCSNLLKTGEQSTTNGSMNEHSLSD